MIPTPFTFDDDRQHFEYCIYVRRTDAIGNQIDMPKGRTHDIREAMRILDNLHEAIAFVETLHKASDVVVQSEMIDGLNRRIIVWRDASVIAVLHAWIQIEQARQTSEVSS